jgi:adenosylmethionine-8-amino-7-oxononanoate aminotransferase
MITDPIWRPCTQMKDHETWPPIRIRRGQGIYLWDADGNRYMDAISSWWVNLLGHCHPRIMEAVRRQTRDLEQVIFAGFTHGPAEDLVARLLHITPPGLTRVFFADNGSAAVEVALKMSHGFHRNLGRPGRTRFAYLTHGYHGETLGALSVCGEDLYAELFGGIMLDNARVAGPDCFRCPYGRERVSGGEFCDAPCFEHMERTLSERGDLAAVILEPLVQCAGDFRMYPPTYLRKLRAATKEAGVLLILDEIATGFGRTGTMFACEQAGIAPDLMCLSKGVTGGTLPLSLVLATEEIYEAFYGEWAEMKAFLHSHSYTGNALACAAAAETLAVLAEEDTIAANRPKWEHLQAAVRERFEPLPYVGEVRCQGFIAAVELVTDRKTREPLDWRGRTGTRIFREALSRGALLRNLPNIVYFMPPYCIDHDQIEELADIALASTRAVLG